MLYQRENYVQINFISRIIELQFIKGKGFFFFLYFDSSLLPRGLTRVVESKDTTKKSVFVRQSISSLSPRHLPSVKGWPGDFFFYLGYARRACALAPLSLCSPLPVSSEASHPLCWAHSISNIRYISSPGIWSSSLPSWSASGADGTLDRVWRSPDRSGPWREGGVSRTAARPNRSEEAVLYILSQPERWWRWRWQGRSLRHEKCSLARHRLRR